MKIRLLRAACLQNILQIANSARHFDGDATGFELNSQCIAVCYRGGSWRRAYSIWFGLEQDTACQDRRIDRQVELMPEFAGDNHLLQLLMIYVRD
jgi:hypothetical protein